MKKKQHHPLRALFVGFGNVGQKMAAMLTSERKQFPGLQDLELETIGILTRSRGGLVDQAGIDLAQALNQFREKGAFPGSNPLAVQQAVEELDYDVLVELSTLSIADKGEPAISHVHSALKRGRHVVTANKGPAAFAYRELDTMARKNDVCFLFESAVMDGAPVFSLQRHALRGCRVTGISGILNTTTNFVISRLEQGETMVSAIKTAQEMGFAEADPALDIEGWDASAKIAILANVFMEAEINPFQVERQGISDLTAAVAAEAVTAGKRLKLICRAWQERGCIRAKVSVEAVPADHCLATVSGKGAALRLETDMMGPILIIQENPTLADTAAGVLFDLMTVQETEKEI